MFALKKRGVPMAKTIKTLILIAFLQGSNLLSLQKIRGKAELIDTLGKGKPVVVKAVMQGCGACSMIKDAIESLQKDNPEVIIVEAELGENADLVREENISAAPTFLFYKKGASKPHDKVVGANKQAVEEKVKALKADTKQEKEKTTEKKAVTKKEDKVPTKKKSSTPKEKPTKEKAIKKSKTKKPAPLKHEIVQLKGKTDLDNLLKKGKPVVVKTEMTGCGACVMIKDTFESLHKEHPDIIFAVAEQTDNRDLMSEFKVAAFPTFLFFKENSSQPHDTIRGANKDLLTQKVKALSTKDSTKQVKKEPSKKVKKEAAPKKKSAVSKKSIKKSPTKRPVPIKRQKQKVASKKYVQEQRVGKGCKTKVCSSCEGCSTC
jgi:thioredoxin 1